MTKKRNPKTTIAGCAGLLVLLAAKLGLNVSAETMVWIVSLVLAVVSKLAHDATPGAQSEATTEGENQDD